MRERWTRGEPTLTLTRDEVAALLPDRAVLVVTPTTGGLANTNLRIDTTTGSVHLRLWTRDPKQAAKELSLHSLVARRVRVPRLLHSAPDNPITGHPFAVMEWIDAPRLEQIAPSPALAHAIGRTLGAIHSFTFPRTGFLDEHLDVVTPATVDAAAVRQFLHDTLVGNPHVAPELTKNVLDVVERDGHLLDAWSGPPCLTHSDFNGSNLLVRDDAVAAVLDWEFAFSGSPFFDLGNLLRPPLGDDESFVAAVAERYGPLPSAWRRISQLLDLMAWADFLSRPNPGSALIADAHAMLERAPPEVASSRASRRSRARNVPVIAAIDGRQHHRQSTTFACSGPASVGFSAPRRLQK
jgi:aminoglycoside phosphotransferase (APT) family kinase protein